MPAMREAFTRYWPSTGADAGFGIHLPGDAYQQPRAQRRAELDLHHLAVVAAKTRLQTRARAAARIQNDRQIGARFERFDYLQPRLSKSLRHGRLLVFVRVCRCSSMRAAATECSTCETLVLR